LLEHIARLIRLQPRTVGDLNISDAMRQMEVLLRRVANIDSSLLITGESGVGNEVAPSLFTKSRRAPMSRLSRSIAERSPTT
jgi:DNA-binding NtrC family response regulator